MEEFVSYAGKSNVGFKQHVNEDYILCDEKNFGGDAILACIADGSGSKDGTYRPANIACSQVDKMIQRFYKSNAEMCLQNIRIIMEQAMRAANDVLVAFKLGDEEGRFQYATTLTCAFLERNGRLTMTHCGNTRLYVLRGNKIRQISRDHTDGQTLVDNGTITEDEYYTSVERLRLNNGIGMYADPKIQTAQMKLKPNDVVIMTTDGIHYSYRASAFYDILMSTKNMDEAADTIIQTALDWKNYPDNLSTILMWLLPVHEPEKTQKEEA